MKDYFQYWTFGDGTGSFQQNPEHTYPANGVYTVKLYTFKDDCGCWDVQTQRVEIQNTGRPPGGCDIYYQQYPDPNDPQTLIFTFDAAFSYVNPPAPISTVYWDFGDGSPIEYGLTVSHTFDSGAEPDVTCTVEFAPVSPETNGCIAAETKKMNVAGALACCDKKDREKVTDIVLFGGGFKAKTIDQLCGYTFYGLIGGRVKSQLTFYKQKSGGGWKREKADNVAVWYEVDIYLLESGICSTLQTIAGNKDKDNESGVLKWHNPSNDPFGVQDNGAQFKHQVIYNGVYSPELVSFLGSCN